MRYYKEGTITATPQVAGVIRPTHETILADGWFEYIDIQPPFDASTQRIVRGAVIDGVVQYTVVQLTAEEIQENSMSQAEAERAELIQVESERLVMETFKSVPDEELVDTNPNLFPFWERLAMGKRFEINERVQAFIDGEAVLMRVVQAHNKQADWHPSLVPALFTRVAFEGEILDWVQPLGSEDAYQIGDKVNHNGQVWESNTANNVWEPGVFGWIVV